MRKVRKKFTTKKFLEVKRKHGHVKTAKVKKLMMMFKKKPKKYPMHPMQLKNIVWKMLKKLMKVKIIECVNIGWNKTERRKHAVQCAQKKMAAISLKKKETK